MITLVGIATHVWKQDVVQERPRVLIEKNQGLIGDHHAKLNSKRQVIVVSLPSWRDACTELGRLVNWTARRANLLISERRFGPDDVGKLLQIGHVVLRITGECTPCEHMDKPVPGLREALMPDWRGGVTCSVVERGEVHVGNTVFVLDPVPLPAA